MRNDEDCGPQALILVPNADLARQIKRTFENTWTFGGRITCVGARVV